MGDIAVDRLSLKLSGLSRSDGERLGRLIAEGLGAAKFSDHAPHQVETMNVNIQTDARSDVNSLSRQIVGEILRQLASTV